MRLVAIASGWALELCLKGLFAKPRPDLVPRLVAVNSDSFPSGHASNLAVVYIGIGLAFAAISSRPWRRRAILTV